MLAGQVMLGGWSSCTFTVNKHEVVLSELSVAVHVTAFGPFGKVDPDGGVQDTVTPGQLSDAVGVVY